MRGSLLLSLLVVAGMAACSSRPSPPTRPKGIPDSAVWAGGVDGGAFIECKYILAARLDVCTVYNDSTGEVWMKGKFHLHGTDHGIPLSPGDYSFADGTIIGLTANRGYLEQ